MHFISINGRNDHDDDKNNVDDDGDNHHSYRNRDQLH